VTPSNGFSDIIQGLHE